MTLTERQELEGIEERILEAEALAAELEAKLNDAEFQTQRFAEVLQCLTDFEAARERVASLYARWETLESLR